MKTLITLFILTLSSGNLFAGGENETKYRVVASQAGNVQVTSTSNEVSVIKSDLLYVPNAFTPDGDGINDTWGAVGQGFSEFSMQVFNRWGEMIFESNDITQLWDGTFKNEKVQDGVYVYQIKARSADKMSFYNKSGSVTLVR